MKWHKFSENGDSSPYQIKTCEHDAGRISANFECGMSHRLIMWRSHKAYPLMCSIYEGHLTDEFKNPGAEVFFVVTIAFTDGSSYDIVTDGEKLGYVKSFVGVNNNYVRGGNCIITDEVPPLVLTSAHRNAILEMGRLLVEPGELRLP